MYTYSKHHSWITKKYLNVCGYIDVAMTDCVITAGVVISSRRWRKVGEQGFGERENEAGKHSPTCIFNTCVSLDLEMRTFDLILYEGTAHRRRFATGVVTVITFLSHLIFIKKYVDTVSSSDDDILPSFSSLCTNILISSNIQSSLDRSSMPPLLCPCNSPLALPHIGHI